MQKNVKGLLCSLIHQALSREFTVLDKILTQTTSYREKDHDTDWSVKELGSLCLDILISYPSAVCIFVDGLDEICSSDVLALLKLLDDMRSLPNVKVCVASRPQALFWRRFGNHQQMRLQDLTRRDMCAYARSVLRPGWRGGSASSSPNFPNYMLSDTVDKAEGVFLWLHLATRSLLQGWENGDDMDELKSRLEALPSGLSELYADIWSRLNDDGAIYRTAAAEYFHLLLDARILDEVPESRDPYVYLMHSDVNLTLVQFMVLTTRRLREKALDPSLETSRQLEKEETIRKLCQETEISIQRRCGGLVEVRDRVLSINSEVRRRGECVVTFIHRTAYDFLIDTEEGLRILSFYKCREEERCLRLAQGLLASSRFRRQRLDPICIALRRVRSPDLKARTFEVLRMAEKFWDAGKYLFTSSSLLAKPKLHFLSVVATEGFTEFALSTISQARRPRELATEVLVKSLVMVPLHDDTQPRMKINGDFLRSLLRLGADLNTRSIFEAVDLSGWKLTAYGLRMTHDVAMIDGPEVAAKDLISTVLQTRVTPHGRILFCINIGPKGPALMSGNGSTKHWEGIKRHGRMGKYPDFRKPELIFVVDSSRAFLLEVARFLLSEYMTAADMGVEENPRLGIGTSSSGDICVPFVQMCETLSIHEAIHTWRIVDGGIRAHLASLFRHWLLPGDDSWMEMDGELIAAARKVGLDMHGRPEEYERVYGSVTHLFGAEECCSSPGRDVDGGPRAEDGGP